MNRALITGASAGLGSEFARQLAAQGKSLILVARRVEPMERLAADLRDRHDVEVDVLTADMSVPGAPAELHAQTRKRGFDIDFLIIHSGSEATEMIRTRDWSRQFEYLRLTMTSVAGM